MDTGPSTATSWQCSLALEQYEMIKNTNDLIEILKKNSRQTKVAEERKCTWPLLSEEKVGRCFVVSDDTKKNAIQNLPHILLLNKFCFFMKIIGFLSYIIRSVIH